MKKLLVALTGLVGLATSSVTTLSTEVATKTELGPQATPKTWTFTEKNESKYLTRLENLYVAIDNINLTAMGIKGIDGLHEYNSISIPGLKISFLGYSPQINGDVWGAKKRNIGSESWNREWQRTINGTDCIIDTAATLWYSGNGNLMMRLAYRAKCFKMFTEQGGVVSIKTGTEVKFY